MANTEHAGEGVMEQRWYVCEAQPRSEKTAREQIFGRGFEVIFPTFLERRKVKGGWKRVEMSAFGPYLFVRFDITADPWHRIASTRGVKRIFCGQGDRPMPLPRAAERDLVERFSAAPLPNIDAVLDVIQEGMRVSIVDGPFAGQIGVCRWSTEARIALLLSVFGGPCQVELDTRSVLALP